MESANSTTSDNNSNKLSLFDELGIFFLSVFGFYSTLYICTKLYVKRKRSRSISDADINTIV